VCLDIYQLSASEELGDFARSFDIKLALQIYYRAEIKHKVIACFAETQQYDKIVPYAQTVGYQPDWQYLLQNIIAVNPAGAVGFAQMLVTAAGGPLVDTNTVCIELYTKKAKPSQNKQSQTNKAKTKLNKTKQNNN
jgi:clathrin heavy chain